MLFTVSTGLNAWSTGLPKVSDHPIVSSMVNASQRILGKPKAKKEPITSEMLKTLVTSEISDKSPSLSDLPCEDSSLMSPRLCWLFSFQ